MKNFYFSPFRAFFILLSLFIFSSSIAQVTPQWVAKYNGVGTDYEQGQAITKDASGNTYVACYSYLSGIGANILVIKYSPAGVIVWEARYSGGASGDVYPYGIKLDHLGNVIVVGHQEDYNANPYTGADYLIIKYDANGNKLWHQLYDYNTDYDYAYSFAIDALNNICVTGDGTNINTWTNEIVTVKYGPSGNLIWSRAYIDTASNYSNGASIDIDGFDNVYVGGSRGSVGISGYDGIILKYDSAGVFKWKKVIAGDSTINATDAISHIDVDVSGNTYAVGQTFSTTATSTDYLVVKCNPNGNLVWDKRYSSAGARYDYARKVILNGSSLYVTGNISTATNSYDWATVKYDTAGNYQWDQIHFGIAGAFSDVASDIAVDGAGNVYVGGYVNLSTGHLNNYGIVKYNPSGVKQWDNNVNGPGANSDICTAIAVSSSGDVHLTGYMHSGTDNDVGTVKYNTAGIKQWQVYYNSPGTAPDEAMAITVNAGGNVYVTGRSYRGASNPNIATVKYDGLGNQLWSAVYNSPGTNSYDEPKGIAIDNSGNVYVAALTVSAAGKPDFTTIKYNSSGIEQWVNRYPGASSEDAAGIAVDKVSGDVYVTGYVTVHDTNYDYLTIKYTTAGATAWTKTYNDPVKNSFDFATSVKVNASNTFVYVTGSSTINSYDILTIKYDASNGNPVWTKAYDGPSNSVDQAKELVLDAADNIYIAGRSRISSNYDFITIKYDAAGTKLWDKPYNNFGFDDAKSIAVHNASGDVYVTGTSTGGSSADDIATIKYDAAGTQKWVKRYNNSSNLADNPGGIVVDSYGNAYVTGLTSKTPTDINYITLSYSANGSLLWKHDYDGTSNRSDLANAITIDASGAVYVTGASYDTLSNYDFTTIKFCIASAGVDTSICKGKSVSLNASGGTTYNWGPATGLSCTSCASPVATPTATIAYVVAVTNGSCTGIDTVRVTVFNVPNPTVSSNANICPGSNTQLSAWGAATYKWSPATGLTNPNVANPIAFPTLTTAYTVTLTNASGCITTAPVTVSVSPLPVADAGTPQTLCSGDSVQLNGSGASGGSYIWNPPGNLDNATSEDPKASPFFTTTYTLTVIDGTTSCNNTDTVSVIVIQAPAAFAGIDTNVCQGAVISFGSLAPGANSYTWSPAQGLSCTNCITPTVSSTVTTTYTFVVTNGSCNDTDMVMITVDTVPIVFAGPDDTICGAGNSTMLIATGGNSYTWSPSTGLSCTNCPNPTVTLNGTATYTVTAASAAQCPNSDVVTVHVVSAPTPSIIQNGTTLASASSYASYQWYLNATTLPIPGAMNQTYGVTQNATYILIVYDANGCSATTSYTFLNYSVEEAPSISNMQLYPNPNEGTFALDFFINVPNDYILSIRNTLGQEVYRQGLTNLSGNFHQEFDITPFGKSIYFLQISSSNFNSIKKITTY